MAGEGKPYPPYSTLIGFEEAGPIDKTFSRIWQYEDTGAPSCHCERSETIPRFSPTPNLNPGGFKIRPYEKSNWIKF
jgi:hypothetical protein